MGDTTKTQVHRVVVLVVDHDGLGADGVKSCLENTKYPNHCMWPQVVTTDTVDVEWSDDSPLNKRATWRTHFEWLFGKGDGYARG